MAPQDPHSKGELELSPQGSHGSQGKKPNNHDQETPVTDSGSTSTTSTDSRKITPDDIELVHRLIERCLQLYMSRGEVVRTLFGRARIEPAFSTLVWQKLEKENPDFFRAYYIRLKLKKQVIMFNKLLEHQYQMMKYPIIPPKIPITPIQNGIHTTPVNSLPMGYPLLQQPPMPIPAQPHLVSSKHSMPSSVPVNGIPASGGFRRVPIKLVESMKNSKLAMPLEITAPPASLASNSHFPFTPAEVSGSRNDTPFVSEMGSSEGMQLEIDVDGGGAPNDTIPSLDHIQWDFSLLSDITSLADLGDLENYTGSPFLPSDSDIFMESPNQDDIANAYFVDDIDASCTDPDYQKS